MALDLSGKRVLLLGAETELGCAIASTLADASARLALIGASNDAETAFAVQRLARKLNAEVSQAIDATNDMAVRVMVRQVAKVLGSFEAVVFCADMGDETGGMLNLTHKYAGKELRRDKRRIFIAIVPYSLMKGVNEILLSGPPPGVKTDFGFIGINRDLESVDALRYEVVREVAAIPS